MSTYHPDRLSSLPVMPLAAARLAAVMIACGWLSPCLAAATDLRLTVRLVSGDVALLNNGIDDLPLTAYQITSQSGSLIPANWEPIAGNLDGAGDMSFSSDFYVTFPADTGDLGEGTAGDGGILAAGDFLSIGEIWNPFGVGDLVADVGVGDALLPLDVVYVSADFNGDFIVDSADLALWEDGFGISSGALPIDGDADADGDVDSRDFFFWFEEVGATGLVSPTGALVVPATGTGIPEPTSGLGCVAGICTIMAVRRHPAALGGHDWFA